MQQRYSIKGMSCAACAARIDKKLGECEGVNSVDVNLLTNSMEIDYEDDKLSDERIRDVVSRLGFEASIDAGEKLDMDSIIDENKEDYKKRFVVSLVFMLPLFVLNMIHMHGIVSLGISKLWIYIISAILVLPIVVVNHKYYKNGILSLFRGSANMDSLIAVGTIASIASLSFESAGMILTLVTLGKFLEAKSKGKTGDAIKKLINLAPDRAMVIRGDKKVEVATADIRSGDLLAIMPGDRIPVDGIVYEGETSLDQSAITGESIPCEKITGDEVISASINAGNYFVMKATKVGDDTTLSKITKLVEKASATKAPIAKVADKVAGIFIPVVILVAAITFAAWMFLGRDFSFSMQRAVAVLVVSCPCALGLATPLAIMVATGRGADLGILIKDAESLENASSADVVVLDKTGTLTEGRPTVQAVNVVAMDEREALSIAASIEKQSNHPLARAIVGYAESKGVSYSSEQVMAKSSVGLGMDAEISGSEYRLGKLDFINPEVSIEEEEMLKTARINEDEGATSIFLGKKTEGGKYRLLAVFSLTDVLKSNAVSAIDKLNNLGLVTCMLTGDNERSAKFIATKLGVKDFAANLMPADKTDKLTMFKKAGKRTIMVGDGINDAPAIATSDVGIAVGAGTDIAIDSADIVISADDIYTVYKAVLLSKRAMKTIKENLMWAFIYNIICIPFAAGFFIPLFGIAFRPEFAAAAMSFSSISVVLNSLRIRKFQAN